MTSATERIDHPPRVREAINELMRKKDVTDNRTTELLRRLLDERGVEHYDGTESTLWLKDEHGYRASADELPSGRLSVHIWCDTPEQAIAATLGGGTLTAEQIGEAIERNFTKICVLDDGKPVEWREDWVCRVGIDYRAIADELNELGSGTCENIAPDYLDFLCSKCGFVHYHSDENDTGDGNDWNCCPNCGKRIRKKVDA